MKTEYFEMAIETISKGIIWAAPMSQRITLLKQSVTCKDFRLFTCNNKSSVIVCFAEFTHTLQVQICWTLTQAVLTFERAADR